jgi:hypothetical protein
MHCLHFGREFLVILLSHVERWIDGYHIAAAAAAAVCIFAHDSTIDQLINIIHHTYNIISVILSTNGECPMDITIKHTASSLGGNTNIDSVSC